MLRPPHKSNCSCGSPSPSEARCIMPKSKGPDKVSSKQGPQLFVSPPSDDSLASRRISSASVTPSLSWSIIRTIDFYLIVVVLLDLKSHSSPPHLSRFLPYFPSPYSVVWRTPLHRPLFFIDGCRWWILRPLGIAPPVVGQLPYTLVPRSMREMRPG